MLGIKNYNPKFYTELTHIIIDYKKKLDKIKGKKIEGIWIAWNQEDDEWFNDLPVVIKFEDCQLELCANKTDEFAVSFDEINMSDEIEYFGTDIVLKWENNKLSEFKKCINKRIDSIEIIEWRNCLFGIGLSLEEGYLTVFNGLDENKISIVKDINQNYKYTYV
ncbi:hypothetical protein [Gottfriedia acidiceleris]|uniref:hypothetical protein n=1 Tax=Gottfriedia acidiceleris TaxID=371036 RepID=UPI003D207DEE